MFTGQTTWGPGEGKGSKCPRNLICYHLPAKGAGELLEGTVRTLPRPSAMLLVGRRSGASWILVQSRGDPYKAGRQEWWGSNSLGTSLRCFFLCVCTFPVSPSCPNWQFSKQIPSTSLRLVLCVPKACHVECLFIVCFSQGRGDNGFLKCSLAGWLWKGRRDGESWHLLLKHHGAAEFSINYSVSLQEVGGGEKERAVHPGILEYLTMTLCVMFHTFKLKCNRNELQR